MVTLRVGAIAQAVILASTVSGTAMAQTTTVPEQVPRPAAQSVPSAGESRITWTITERVRYAGLFNQFRPGFSGDDRAMVFRTTLHAEFASPHVTVGGEVQDARAYLTDAQSNVSTALVNPIDLLQAYVRLGAGPTQARVRDVTRTFTGAKVQWRPHANGMVTGFGVFPVATLPDGRDDLLRNRIAPDAELFNQRFWGALYERERLAGRIRAEAYLYGLRERDVPGRHTTRDRKLWTAGLRLYRAPSVGAWDLDVESA